ncbi:MAG: hypothetical protein IV090_25680 [Candidatus Sericytochromatia bacterium]|nr:hypothetical protein [Candidatus Sericytochromatia bacterium]
MVILLFFFDYGGKGWRGPYVWHQYLELDFQKQQLIYRPFFLFILIFDPDLRRQNNPLSVVAPEIIHSKREIMAEAEALGGKSFRQKYCQKDCQIFLSIGSYGSFHSEENSENELPFEISKKWGSDQTKIHYKSPDGAYFTVFFLEEGKKWIIDGSKPQNGSRR